MLVETAGEVRGGQQREGAELRTEAMGGRSPQRRPPQVWRQGLQGTS